MKRKNGFTLIELLAVIAIIGIIATIGVLSITRIINKNDQESVITDGKKLADAAVLYYNEQGSDDKDCITFDELNNEGFIDSGEIVAGSVKIKIDSVSNKMSYDWYIMKQGYYIYQQSSQKEPTINKYSNINTYKSKANNCGA